MATIGSIAVSLRADTKKFVSGMGKATATLKRFSRSIPGVSALTSKLGLALGALTGGSLAYFIKSQADAIDATAKFADRIGATTEGLVGLEHAARISGVGISALHMGLQRMTRRVAEAAQGTGEAQGALRELGLDAESLSSMRPEEVFQRIADRMGQVRDQSDRVRLAMKLFDSEGVALVNTLAMGSEGLQAMQREAEDLGLTFTRLDAAKVEAANDAFTRLGEMIQGAGRAAAVELAPYMEVAFRKLVEWGTAGEGMGAKVVTAIEWIVSAVGTVIDIFNVFKGIVQTSVGISIFAFGGLTKAIGVVINAAERLVEILTLGFVEGEIGKGIEKFADDLLGTASDMVDAGTEAIRAGFAGEGGEDFLAALRQIKEEANAAAEETLRLAEAGRGTMSSEDLAAQAADLDRQSQARREAADAAEREAKALEQLARTTKERLDREERILAMSKEEREWADAILEIEELRAAGLDELAEQAERILEAKKEELRIEEEKQKLVEKTQELQREAERRAEETRRRQEAQARNTSALREELELLRAANEYERERIRIKNELLDRVREAEGDLEQVALARKIADEKLAELERQRAEDAERTAKAAQETATATASTTTSLRAQLDITKRFENFGGTSIFGFGRGQVGRGLGDISQDVARANRGATPFSRTQTFGSSPAGATQTAEVPELPDLAPHVQAVVKAWKKVPPLWERLQKELKELESGTVDGVDRMGRATERAVLQMKTAVRELQAKVRSFEERLKRASDLGVAGG